MPALHQPYELLTAARGEDVGPPDLRDVLDRSAWTAKAVCADSESDLWFAEEPTHNPLQSGPVLLALLGCAKCPVRVECLTASLQTWSYTVGTEGPVSVNWTAGTWGGTTERERHEVKELPIGKAVAVLEAEFPKRLARREKAWRRRVEGKSAHPSPFDKALFQILGARSESSVTRFHLHGPGGPGRGHRGPVAELAATLGVSRSTAWRRLRATVST